LCVTGLRSLCRDKPELVGLLIVPAALGTVVVTSMGHPLWPRFFFFLSGFAALVLVRGVMTLGEAVGRLFTAEPAHVLTVGTTLCVVIIGASAVSVSAAYAPKQDFAGALAYIEQHRGAGDAVVTVGLAAFPYSKFYHTGWQQVLSQQELEAVLQRAKRTWLVYTMPLHVRSYHPDLMRTIEQRFQTVRRFEGTLSGGTVYVTRADALSDSRHAGAPAVRERGL
jgi:hypothetical protein